MLKININFELIFDMVFSYNNFYSHLGALSILSFSLSNVSLINTILNQRKVERMAQEIFDLILIKKD